MFVVDCSLAVLRPREEGRIHIQVALDCIAPIFKHFERSIDSQVSRPPSQSFVLAEDVRICMLPSLCCVYASSCSRSSTMFFAVSGESGLRLPASRTPSAQPANVSGTRARRGPLCQSALHENPKAR